MTRRGVAATNCIRTCSCVRKQLESLQKKKMEKQGQDARSRL